MGIEELLQTISQGASVVRQFAIALASNVIGFFFLISAGIKLVKWGDPRRSYGVAAVIVRAIVGTLFIQASAYLNMAVLTVTGYGMPDNNAMSVMPSGDGGIPAMVFKTALLWLGTLGAIAILNGARMLVKASDGQTGQSASQEDPMWTGFIYIGAGAIGINIWRFVGDLI